jgi:hypothetical protein
MIRSELAGHEAEGFERRDWNGQLDEQSQVGVLEQNGYH